LVEEVEGVEERDYFSSPSLGEEAEVTSISV
jgi:hypothetical protein